MIKQCKCQHQEQDRINGKGNRVYNPTTKPKKDGGVEHRCSVCGKQS
jgi:hypothetical protein